MYNSKKKVEHVRIGNLTFLVEVWGLKRRMLIGCKTPNKMIEVERTEIKNTEPFFKKTLEIYDSGFAHEITELINQFDKHEEELEVDSVELNYKKIARRCRGDHRFFDWTLLHQITNIEPDPRRERKEKANKKLCDEVYNRDNRACRLCGSFEKLHTHHIIPNGEANLQNLVLLCKYCHQTVHNILYVSGKWKYVDVSKGMYVWGRDLW